MPALNTSYFSSVQRLQILAADATSLSINSTNGYLANNPVILNVNTGSVMSVAQGIDGLNYLRGSGEFPPVALELQWKNIGYGDYVRLAALAPYYLDLITYRNVGYHGRLVLDGIKNSGIKTADVLQLKAVFFVLNPSDAGGAVSVARIPTPTTLSVTNSNTNNTGYIAASLASYYWLTFSSKYGETLPQASGSVSNSHTNTYNDINWTWPSSTAYCEKASIYVSNASTPGSSRLIAEVPRGQTATWRDYVGFQSALVNRQPPVASTAYRGQWSGSIFTSEP